MAPTHATALPSPAPGQDILPGPTALRGCLPTLWFQKVYIYGTFTFLLLLLGLQFHPQAQQSNVGARKPLVCQRGSLTTVEQTAEGKKRGSQLSCPSRPEQHPTCYFS